MADELDDAGFLKVRGDCPTPCSVTVFEAGKAMSRFQREFLESALWAFGEEALLDLVRRGIGRASVDAIGEQHAVILATSDPARASGHGYPHDKALAMAAVRILEGADRPLARKRRRSR